MPKPWKLFLILGLTWGIPAPFCASDIEPVPVPRPLTAAYLTALHHVPFYFETDPGCPEYLAIVNLGLPVVPELIDLLENPTYTDHRVPLFAGNYAVGDIAMTALSDIIRDIPWLTFIVKSDDPKIAELGFGVYWEYVRASPTNRQTLKKRARVWFEQNRDKLVWQSNPNLPSGGMYVLPANTIRRDG